MYGRVQIKKYYKFMIDIIFQKFYVLPKMLRLKSKVRRLPMIIAMSRPMQLNAMTVSAHDHVQITLLYLTSCKVIKISI